MQSLQSFMYYIASHPYIVFLYGNLVGAVIGVFIANIIRDTSEGREYVMFLEKRRKHEKHLVDLLAESDAHSANED